MAMLTKIWNGVRALLGLIVPTLAKAKDLRTFGPQYRWILRITLIVVILALLGWVNARYFKVFVQTGSETLRTYLYLPCIALILYTLFWLVWWIFKIWGTPNDESQFPDIDKAWDEAVGALDAARIDITEAPLFLILGRTSQSESALLTSANMAFDVKQVPARSDSPVRVYANRNAIFVTCPGASLLGRHAAILAGDGFSDAAGPADDAFLDITNDPNKTITPDQFSGHARQIRDIIEQAQAQGRSPKDLTEEERRRIDVLVAKEKEEAARKLGRSRASPLKNASEVENLKARLRHLCRLIVRDRHPYCSVNGLLVTIPATATEQDEDAKQTEMLCQQDLRTARAALEVYCPHFALVSDLEAVAGFEEFVKRFPREQRQRRVGQRFPLIPDIDASALESKVDEVAHWICTALVPSWVYRLFRVERSGSDSTEAAVAGNVQLFRFTHQMRERRKRLGRILASGVAGINSGPAMFGGCYITGTSPDTQDSAFATGVFQRLVQEQSAVSWTDSAVADEAKYTRWIRLAYATLAVSTVVFIFLLFILVQPMVT